jgi:hypothetical protein
VHNSQDITPYAVIWAYTRFVPCEERKRLAAIYLDAVSAPHETTEKPFPDEDEALLAFYNHQIEHGCWRDETLPTSTRPVTTPQT